MVASPLNSSIIRQRSVIDFYQLAVSQLLTNITLVQLARSVELSSRLLRGLSPPIVQAIMLLQHGIINSIHEMLVPRPSRPSAAAIYEAFAHHHFRRPPSLLAKVIYFQLNNASRCRTPVGWRRFCDKLNHIFKHPVFFSC